MTQYDELSLDAVGDVDDSADRVDRVRRCELPNSVNALVSAYDETVGVGSFLSEMEKRMSYHLATRGLK